MKLILHGDGTWDAECEGDTQQELFKQAAFWHSLPTVCPVDDTPVRFGYKEAGDYKYFNLVSTGDRVYEFPVGVGLDGRGMFAGKVIKEGNTKVYHQRWVYYDHDKQTEIVVWQDGRLLVDAPSHTQPVRQAQPVVQATEIVHRNIATDAHAQLDATLDEAEELDGQDAAWHAMQGALDNKQKPKANEFVWPTDDDSLQMAADILQYDVKHGDLGKRLIARVRVLAEESGQLMSQREYTEFSALIEKHIGAGSDAMIMSALLGKRLMQGSQYPSGKVLEIVNLLRNRNASVLSALSQVAASIKEAMLEAA